MIRTTIKCLLAFFAASIMMSCGGKDEGEDYDLGFGMGIRPLTQIDAKVQIMDKSDMPQWLAEKIEEMETGHNSVPWAYVYQGKWNSETIYFIETPFDNSMFYHVYHEDGEHFNWDVHNLRDVYITSSQWVCIYFIFPVK